MISDKINNNLQKYFWKMKKIGARRIKKAIATENVLFFINIMEVFLLPIIIFLIYWVNDYCIDCVSIIIV